MIKEIKRRNFLMLSLLGIFMPVVSAQSDPIATSFRNAFSSVLGFFFGAVDSEELLFVKFLAFILILAIVRFAVSRIPAFEKNKALIAIISVIVALLAIKYVTSEELVKFIWLPYGVLGIAISSILPLVIFFYFIESVDSDAIRKIGWVAFGVIYAALAALRWPDLRVKEAGVFYGYSLAWLYLIVAIISFLILIFEKPIRLRMMIGMIRRGEDTHSVVLKSELREELGRVNRALASQHLTPRDESRLKEEKKRIEKAIARIS